MNKLFYICILSVFILASFGCRRNSDPFIGDWVQVAEWNGTAIPKGEHPYEMRITADGIFYRVEANIFDTVNGKFEPYPNIAGERDTAGKYQASGVVLSSLSRPDWTIEYRVDKDSLYENAWLGYFVRK